MCDEANSLAGLMLGFPAAKQGNEMQTKSQTLRMFSIREHFTPSNNHTKQIDLEIFISKCDMTT